MASSNADKSQSPSPENILDDVEKRKEALRVSINQTQIAVNSKIADQRQDEFLLKQKIGEADDKFITINNKKEALKRETEEKISTEQATVQIMKDIQGKPATEENIKAAYKIYERTGEFPDSITFEIDASIPGTPEHQKKLVIVSKDAVLRIFGSGEKKVNDKPEKVGIEAQEEALRSAAAKRFIEIWIAKNGKQKKDAFGHPENSADIRLLTQQDWFPKFFTTISLFASVLEKNKTELKIAHNEQHIGSTPFMVALTMGVERLAEASDILGSEVKEWRDDPGKLLADPRSPLFIKADGYPQYSIFWTSPTADPLTEIVHRYKSKKHLPSESPPRFIV